MFLLRWLICVIVCIISLHSVCGASSVASSPTLSLDSPVYFLKADGSVLHVQAGSYRIEPADEWLRMVPEAGTLRDAILLEAHKGFHEDNLQAPEAHAFLGEGEELMHLVLLMPGGNVWESIGSVKGIWPRGALPYVYQRKGKQTPFGYKRQLYGRLRVTPPTAKNPRQQDEETEFQDEPGLPIEIGQQLTNSEPVLKQEVPDTKLPSSPAPGT